MKRRKKKQATPRVSGILHKLYDVHMIVCQIVRIRYRIYYYVLFMTLI